MKNSQSSGLVIPHSKIFRFAMSTNFSVCFLLVKKIKKKKRVLRTLFSFFLKKSWHPNGPARWTNDKASVPKYPDYSVLSGDGPAPHLNLSGGLRCWIPSVRFPTAFEEGCGDFTAMTRCAFSSALPGCPACARQGVWRGSNFSLPAFRV